MKYKVQIIVKPLSHVSFPIDMLRYDRLYPATEVDSTNIAMTQGLEYVDFPPLNIGLHGYRISKVPDITEARWRSFGWAVTDVSMLKL